MTGPTLKKLAAVLAACSMLAVGGCASSPGGGADQGDTPSAGPRSSRSGLELRRWVLRGLPGQADRALGVLAEPSAMDAPAEARRWQMGGLRVARVSATDVEALREYLGVASADSAASESLGALVQERVEWVGLLDEWVPVHRGPTRAETTAMIDSGPLHVDEGAVSLLGRAWVLPGIDAASLRIELMPQVPVRGAEGTVFVDGAPLMRQSLGASLNDGEALIVFPAGSWDAGIGDEAAVNAARRPEFGPSQPVLDRIGPPAPKVPTLGELMMVVRDPSGDRVLEQVLVLVAHLPQDSGGFETIELGDEPLAAPVLAEPPSTDPDPNEREQPAAEQTEPKQTDPLLIETDGVEAMPESEAPAEPTRPQSSEPLAGSGAP